MGWVGPGPQRKLQQHDSKSVETTKTLGSMMTRVLMTLWSNSEHFGIHFPKIALLRPTEAKGPKAAFRSQVQPTTFQTSLSVCTMLKSQLLR